MDMGRINGGLSSIESYFGRIAETYFIGKEDPRTQSWPLVATPIPLVTSLLVYWASIKFGNQWMRGRPAFNLRGVMLVYNVLMVALSTYITCELLLCCVFRPGFRLWCEPVYRTEDYWPMRLAAAIWWYYISKLIELFDTIIFVLRKKTRQITLLHVYHHSSMPCLWWLVTKYIPGGGAFGGPLVNSIVHIIMYTYYGLTALGPEVRRHLWWKRYLTVIQLVQFVFVFMVSLNAVRLDCGIPVIWPIFQSTYCLSLFVFFSHFYYHTYVKPVFSIDLDEAILPAKKMLFNRGPKKDE